MSVMWITVDVNIHYNTIWELTIVQLGLQEYACGYIYAQNL